MNLGKRSTYYTLQTIEFQCYLFVFLDNTNTLIFTHIGFEYYHARRVFDLRLILYQNQIQHGFKVVWVWAWDGTDYTYG